MLALTDPWALTSSETAAQLRADAEAGLSRIEARRRLVTCGPNSIAEARARSVWTILAAQFRNLVVALLLFAGLVSLAFGEIEEAVAIVAVVAVNALIGFVTELRATRSMEAIRALGHATAKVLRDGELHEVNAVELVPGDVVSLEAGDIVTADMRLLQASKLEANESSLTGESAPVLKGADPVPAETPLAERSSMVFRGTSATRGSAMALVVATGAATEVGRIAELAGSAAAAATPLEQRLEGLGRSLIGVTLGIAVVTTLAGLARGKELFLMIETGIALAVAAIPEGLPIVATLALARGMWRMARRNVLVNRLSAVETLGATSVILTDKTGTLTENQMTAVELVLPGTEVAVGGTGLRTEGDFSIADATVEPQQSPQLLAALEIGALCNNAALQTDGGAVRGIGDPLEVALLVLARKAGLDSRTLHEDWPELREVAFDPETRRMATFHEATGGFRVAVKGAHEPVLSAAAAVVTPDGPVPLDEAERQRWMERAETLAAEGLRVLALAEKNVAAVDSEPYGDLHFVGLVALRDPARGDVGTALASCQAAGVRVVMVTGDQMPTALAIARAVDLTGGEMTAVHGRDIAPELGTAAGRARLLEADVFARVDPEQKLRLIELHQNQGAVVAMTGDGVNDAPALRAADIGVAMGQRGTQVAKEAADMVLRDDSFASIVDAVEHGRVIFANIRRFVLYLLSCNLSEVMVVFVATLAGGPLPILPLQILYLNLVTDVFPALALGLGEGDAELMRRPPRDETEPILTPAHWRRVAIYGAVISVTVLGALWIATAQLHLPQRQAVTVSFLTLALAQVWHVFNMRIRGTGILRNDVVTNPWVWGAVVTCLALLAAALYLPALADALGTESPGRDGLLLALGMSLLPLIIGQAAHSLGATATAGARGGAVPGTS
jgi:Ca2+-transporting ATPase